MNSWDRQTIIKKVSAAADRFGASNPQQKKQLIFSCNNASEREVFFGLFSFFYDPSLQENQFERQQLAGTLLYKVAPPPPIALDDSVYAVAKVWNLSIEELPWYWCKSYSKEKVIEFLTELSPSCIDSELKRSVDTMLYWSRGYEENKT